MTKRNDIEVLFKTHYSQMHRLALSLLHDDDLARDIVNDVFLSLLDGNSDLLVSDGYLLKAIRNRCLTISVTANNIFNSHWDTADRYIQTPLYSEHRTSFGTDYHARLNLSVTYNSDMARKYNVATKSANNRVPVQPS